MTSVVQTVAVTPSNASTVVFTSTATSAGNLGVVELGGAGNASVTAVSVTDNQSGTWAQAIIDTGNGRTATIAYCLSLPAGVTTVTVATTPAATGFYGAGSFEEVSSGGGTWSLDKQISGITAGSAGAATLTLTSSSANVGTTDFVAGVIATGAGGTTGIPAPPATGGWTNASVQQNDASSSSAETCYRINSSAVTDTITWSTGMTTNPGDPGVMQSFKVSGGGGASGGGGIFSVPLRGLGAIAPLAWVINRRRKLLQR